MTALQKVMQHNLELRRENRRLRTTVLVLIVLIAIALTVYARRGMAGELSTVTLCDHDTPPTFTGSPVEQENVAGKWWAKEMQKREICEALPVAKVPYGLKYTGKEWEFSLKLFLKR